VSRPLRFATFLAPNMFPVYRGIADHVGRALGRDTELVVGEDFGAFAAGAADVGFLCGLPYVRLADGPAAPVEPLAAPVLVGARYGGRPVYFSDVVVRRDAPYRSFADLRGSAWAYNDPDSQSGYNVTRHRLLAVDRPAAFFGRVVRAGSHQRSLRLVAGREVDAAAIDSQVLAVELRDHPDLAGALRVIDALGPSTIQPVVAARRLPADLRAAVRAALLAMGEDPAARALLGRGFVERFAPVGDADYDDIRGMLAAVEAAGLPPW
jgi:phosphonate transport system substrate-binding protein